LADFAGWSRSWILATHSEGSTSACFFAFLYFFFSYPESCLNLCAFASLREFILRSLLFGTDERRAGPGGESLGSLTRRPELNLLNVLKRDEARYPILCVDDHKGRDGRINFLRNRRKVNEVRMIDGKTTARAGNDNKRRKRIRPDDIRNLFSGHRAKISRSLNSKQLILLLFNSGAPLDRCTPHIL